MKVPQLRGVDSGPPYKIDQVVWIHDVMYDHIRPGSYEEALSKIRDFASRVDLEFSHELGYEPVICGELDSLKAVEDLAVDLFGDVILGPGGSVKGPTVRFGQDQNPGTYVNLSRSPYEVTPEELKQLQIKRSKSLLSDSVQRLVD